MGYLLTILFSLADIGNAVLFSASFHELRWNKKRTLCLILIALAVVVAEAFLIPGSIYIIPTTCTVFILLVTLFRAPWYKLILPFILSYILVGVFDTGSVYGISLLLGLSYEEFIWKKMLYTVVVGSEKLICFLIAYLFCKYWRRRKSNPIRPSWMLLLVLFPTVGVVLQLIIFIGLQNQEDLSPAGLILSITMAVANVAIIYLINVMEKRTREEQELMLLNQQMEIQTGSILALEKSYRSQRAVTHEFRNQLQTISDLISCGAYREVQDYLHQLQDAQVSKVLAVNTHHPIMDAILNQKHQAAVECGIDIQMQVNDLSGLRIPTNSLVVLFSNLLDNAMEACQRLPENRVIRCSILASDVLYISIRNTSLPVTIVDGMIQTSKAFREEHGFGLVSIRRILDELQGEYAFQYDDGWFQFAAEIPL